MRKRILTLGALNLDIIAEYVKGDQGLPMSSWGKDTERMIDESRWWRIFYGYLSERNVSSFPGGSAANTGAALSAIDPQMEVQVLGLIGDDVEGEYMLSDKYWYGAKCTFETIPGRRTGRAFSYVGEVREGRKIAISPGVNNLFKSEYLSEEAANKAEWIHVSSFAGNAANEQLALALTKLRSINREGIVSFDPGTFLSIGGLTPLVKSILSNCDYIFVKTSELLKISGQNEEGTDEVRRFEAVSRLLAISNRPLAIVVERIPDGYTVYSRETNRGVEIEFEKPLDIEVVDDTGAGDVFNAGYIYCVLRGLTNSNSKRLIRSLLQSHLHNCGRKGYIEFSSCAPIIFASYSSKDSKLVNEFINQFVGTDFTFWTYDKQILNGATISEEIEKGIRECDALAIFVTPDSVESSEVKKELDLAAQYHVRVIPIKLARTTSGDFSDTLFVDVTEGLVQAKEKFIKKYKREN